MFSPTQRFYSLVNWTGIKRSIIHFCHQLLVLLFSASSKRPAEAEKPGANAIESIKQSDDCETITVNSHAQKDLEILGVGASSLVYKVDEHIVLKAPQIEERPGNDAAARYQYHYAINAIYTSCSIRDERSVLRLLERHPHFNITKALDIEHEEGFYFPRYLLLSDLKSPTRADRILWYQQIMRGLVHLHSLGIVHTDLRIDNVLFDKQGNALLSDFGSACPFGFPNIEYSNPNFGVPITSGISAMVSDSTDRFAMGSLIFQMETGMKPKFSVAENGSLILPKTQIEHEAADSIVRRAWLGQYSLSTEMLEDLISLPNGKSQEIRAPEPASISTESLRARIRDWRDQRKTRFGKQRKDLLVLIFSISSGN